MQLPLSYIELNISALRHNLTALAARVPPHATLIAVVKANAYGHGWTAVVPAIESHVYGFQVDDIEELRAVRALTEKPVYVFGYVARSDLQEFVELGGILGVYDSDTLQALHEIGRVLGKRVRVHLKIDALLGRQGILPDEIDAYIALCASLTHVRVEALYTHFAAVDEPDKRAHSRAQHAQLLQVVAAFRTAGMSVQYHISATGGLLTEATEGWGGDFVRLGIGLYGLCPARSLEGCVDLIPTLRWVTHVAQVKELPIGHPIGYGCTYVTSAPERIAVVPQGYSDGLDRGFSNCGEVLIHGQRCSIRGRVAMNMCVVSVAHLPEVAVGDEVVLLGTQGTSMITAEQLANRIGTIHYEIVTRISPLLPRVAV